MMQAKTEEGEREEQGRVISEGPGMTLHSLNQWSPNCFDHIPYNS